MSCPTKTGRPKIGDAARSEAIHARWRTRCASTRFRGIERYPGIVGSRHYTKAETEKCLSKLGALADSAHYGGRFPQSAVFLRGRNVGKVIEIEYLPTAEAAKDRLAKGWPPGKVETIGNAIVWVHQFYPAKLEPSDEDLQAAEQCLS
jgi:hypothetical protein